MEDSDLLKRLSALGFPMLETEETQDVNATLADVVKSKGLRLWEGFPVLLANSAEKGLFNYDNVKSLLKKPLDKSCFASLVLMSLTLYKVLNLKFAWASKLLKELPDECKKDCSVLLNSLKNNEDFKVGHYTMSAERLKSTFNNYFRQAQSKVNSLLSMKEELKLEYALSQVFSPKQKELFLKKLRGEKLSKTEKEYFSRAVKKKALALSNPELHRLAQACCK